MCKSSNIKFYCSKDDISTYKKHAPFDYILLSAVYEHLLPTERLKILDNLWYLLNKSGILFINQTPDRRFPIDMHTTRLPFVNYLPDKLVHFLCRKFSKRINSDCDWVALLRMGIRGATEKEIIEYLNSIKKDNEVVLPLEPKLKGLKNRSQIWYKIVHSRIAMNNNTVKTVLLKTILDIILKLNLRISPYLSLAIQKKIVAFHNRQLAQTLY